MKSAVAKTDAALAAANAIRSRLLLESPPELAVIVGSGLAGIAEMLTDRRSVPYADIPEFVVPSTPGHPGELHVGLLAGRFVAVLSGRAHIYEGHPSEGIVHAIRTLAASGVRRILLCNASGGIRSGLEPGSIVLVSDHINLTWSNPLIGNAVRGEERFPDMSAPYDEELGAAMRDAARAAGVDLHEGVYAAVAGPSYETPAEVKMLARLGADVVGMSTVPEVITARAAGMKCVALSCVTNRASEMSGRALSHEEVLQVAQGSNATMKRLIAEFVKRLT